MICFSWRCCFVPPGGRRVDIIIILILISWSSGWRTLVPIVLSRRFVSSIEVGILGWRFIVQGRMFGRRFIVESGVSSLVWVVIVGSFFRRVVVFVVLGGRGRVPFLMGRFRRLTYSHFSLVLPQLTNKTVIRMDLSQTKITILLFDFTNRYASSYDIPLHLIK